MCLSVRDAVHGLLACTHKEIMHQFHYLFAASLVLVSTAAPAEEKCDPARLPSICTNCVVAAMGAMKNGLTWHAMAMLNRPSAHGTRSRHGQDEGRYVSRCASVRPQYRLQLQRNSVDQRTISMARIQLKYGKGPENN